MCLNPQLHNSNNRKNVSYFLQILIVRRMLEESIFFSNNTQCITTTLTNCSRIIVCYNIRWHLLRFSLHNLSLLLWCIVCHYFIVNCLFLTSLSLAVFHQGSHHSWHSLKTPGKLRREYIFKKFSRRSNYISFTNCPGKVLEKLVVLPKLLEFSWIFLKWPVTIRTAKRNFIHCEIIS